MKAKISMIILTLFIFNIAISAYYDKTRKLIRTKLFK